MHSTLRRDLGFGSTAMLVMGGIVGAGIFRTPADVATLQPSFTGIMLVWVVGGILALTGAIVFAELGGLFPRTGGQYVYLREGYGSLIAFFVWLVHAHHRCFGSTLGGGECMYAQPRYRSVEFVDEGEAFVFLGMGGHFFLCIINCRNDLG